MVFFDFAVSFDDFRIDKSGEGGVFLVVEVITNNNDTLINAELRGGHSGREFVRVVFFPVKRAFYHVGNNLASFVGNFGDFRGLGAETRVGSSNNIHDIIIPCIMR